MPDGVLASQSAGAGELPDRGRNRTTFEQSVGRAGRECLGIDGEGTVHRDDETKQWFLDQFTTRLQPADPVAWRKLLDSPKRVVFEVRVTSVLASHDQRKIAGNGRGMAG